MFYKLAKIRCYRGNAIDKVFFTTHWNVTFLTNMLLAIKDDYTHTEGKVSTRELCQQEKIIKHFPIKRKQLAEHLWICGLQ